MVETILTRGKDHIRYSMLIGVADDEINAGYFFYFFRFRLGITTGYHDPGVGIGSNGLPDRLSGLHGRLLRNRAGIDDTQIRRFLFGNSVPS